MGTRLICIVVAVTLAGCSGASLHDRTLAELDRALEFKGTYEKAFTDKMEAMKAFKDDNLSLHERYRLNLRIAAGYSCYSLDSTLAYLDRDMALASRPDAESGWLTHTRLLKAREYIQAGYHIEAATMLQDMGYDGIPPQLRKLYFEVRHSLAGELMAYAGVDDLYLSKYFERNEMRDSLMKYITPRSYEYYDLNRESALSEKDSAAVRDFAREMIRLSEPDSHEYAKACYLYSEGVPRGEADSILYWLSRSAIADVKCATKDYASLNQIAIRVFRAGDVGRAFKYTANHCMQDALTFGGKLRPWQISRFFPDIEHAYEVQRRKLSGRLVAVVVMTSMLLALLGVMLVRDRRRRAALSRSNAELKTLNAKIKDADKVKEKYLSLFLGMVSDDISKTRKYQNHVLKYLRRGNAKYIEEELELLPPKEDDVRQFYRMFDETFLNLYPDFVEKFNALLADGEAVTPKDSDMLTPELRVFALIRLGVSDSGKIASMLHYSANTVYNYRAKIKNKARRRDSFEDEVRGI